MVGNNNENILVEFDYQNIVLVDPNKTIDGQGNVKERLLRHEDLVYYANLECTLFPRTRLAAGPNGYFNNEKVSIATVNFLKPGNKEFLTNDYLDELTGLDSINGKGTNQIQRNIEKDDKNKEIFLSQTVRNNVDTELLGITQISIDTNLSLFPEVTIQMEDVRGRALFEKGENSPYAVFFNYPYPMFFLTIKGYLGKAVKYQLALRNFNATFDTGSGNFKITVKFYAYKFNVLTQIPMKYLQALPYMYRTNYNISPVNNTGVTPAPTGPQGVTTIPTSKGRQKIKEVYSEYKNKGLIDSDFPEITLTELTERLKKLETYISETFTKADLTPLTDVENFRDTLNKYEQEILLWRGESWFYKYMDTTAPYFTSDKGGTNIYTYKKEVRQGLNGLDVGTSQSDLLRIISKYNTLLKENKTFGEGGKYVIGKKETVSQIDVWSTIKADTISGLTINPESIDYNKSYVLQNNKTPTTDELAQFKTKLQPIFNSVTFDKDGKQVNNWFYFEGEGSFSKLIQLAQNELNTKAQEIQKKLADILSSRLAAKDGGLGFKPTIKNVLAVLLSNAEAFLRLMDDVHQTAWDVREDKNRVNAILGNDKSTPSTDSKDSTQTDSGNLIPIYPWPQYFVETNNDKGEKFELTYPGDPKVISKTKGFLYNVWPEIEFVEEFLKGYTQRKNPLPDYGPLQNTAQDINRVSLYALDFPTGNNIFGNKQEAKFLYEMYERVLLSSSYQRYYKPGSENQISDVIAESEFLNIKNSLENDSPYLVGKLKQYGLNSNNIVPFLAHISSGGIGESWQKYIRGDFATPYIQQEVDNSFVITDTSLITPGNTVVKPVPTQIDKLKTYLKSTQTNTFQFVDTFPYNSTDWYLGNLSKGASSNLDVFNTTNTLFVNNDKKMITNFETGSSKKEIRPITNFNFYDVSTPEPTVGLSAFYTSRTNDKQLPTEGNLHYTDYSGNVVANQTTSMLNTPFFINSIQEGVKDFLTGSTTPFKSSAFLFLNSLPLATLREKYKTYNGASTTDLDYIFATFKKFGAIHRIPYAWVLKYGSIWYRYKTWTETGVDILSNVLTDFQSTYNFDPITNNPAKTYNLVIDGNNQAITLQNTTLVGSDTLTQMNIGFYPQLINDFSTFYRGYDVFSAYTDSEIQSKLTSPNGVTLTLNSDSIINKDKGYDANDVNDILNIKPWSCVLNDDSKKLSYVVPSFGVSTVNQINGECFNNSNKLIQPVKFSPAVFNGSVRTFWSLPNYGYFDTTKIDVPTPEQYFKQILTGETQQQSFLLGNSTAYTTNEEVLSVFNREIMDIMEGEFLKFTKSLYEYSSVQVGSQVTTKIQVDKLAINSDGIYRNFQLLMREMMSIEKVTETNSTSYTNEVQSRQLSKSISTIQQFLEYDVVLKYGNPSNYSRKLFDSFSTTTFIEDKLTYPPYIQNTLPTSGGTTTLAQSEAAYPQSWKNLRTYIGNPTESGYTYTNNGSYITDFFVDMNIQFAPDSVTELATLIRIYATQKKLDPTMNRIKFINLINQYIAGNKSFSDLVFNQLTQKLNTGLPNVEEVKEKFTETAIQGEQTKLDIYEAFKGLNDTWIAGYDYTETTFLEDVLFLDRANRNIGDDILIDPKKVLNLFSEVNESSSVYTYLESVLNVHHFICMMHPAYINYYNVQEVQQNSVPKIEGTLEFGNTLFGTYLNVDARKASPKLVCTYAAEPSKHPEMGKNSNYRFKSDAFDLTRVSDMPLTDKLDGKTDWGLSNRVVGFNVDIGITNQNIFYHFDVSQDLGKETTESLTATDDLIRQSNGKTTSTQNVSLWNFYRNRAYQCRVQTLGNAMIQPTMYFNLRHVPMFTGPYYITDVKHNITPGKFETTFTGTRQQVFALPKLESYIQTLTAKILDEVISGLNQKLNASGNVTTTTTTSNNNTNTSNELSSNTFVINNSQNCKDSLKEFYEKQSYTFGTQSQSELTVKQVIDGIMANITQASTPNALLIAKYLAFVTCYLESYQNNQFICWNNNYGGATLDYVWSGNLSTFFNKEYICQSNANGIELPFAVFSSPENHFKFLGARWTPIATGINSLTPENLTKAWITKWSRMVTPSQYNSYIANQSVEYNNLLDKVRQAVTMASALGLQ